MFYKAFHKKKKVSTCLHDLLLAVPFVQSAVPFVRLDDANIITVIISVISSL